MYASATATCLQHPDVPATQTCARCTRGLCEVCSFRPGAVTLCPDCVVQAADSAPDSAAKGLVSVVLAATSVMTLVYLGVLGLNGEDADGVLAALGGLVMIGAAIAGLAAAVIGRGDARRKPSVLVPIGLAVNGLLVALMFLFILVS